jgi:hypothetical protein
MAVWDALLSSPNSKRPLLSEYLVPVFRRCHIELLLKAFTKVAWIVDTNHIGYLGHVELS